MRVHSGVRGNASAATANSIHQTHLYIITVFKMQRHIFSYEWTTFAASHLPHCLFVGNFDALPLGNSTVGQDLSDSCLISA